MNLDLAEIYAFGLLWCSFIAGFEEKKKAGIIRLP